MKEIEKLNNKTSNKDKAISFIFPVLHGAMGGVQMLFINLIQYLAEQNTYIVRLYDYKQGFIRTHLQLKNITNYEFISLNTSEKVIYNKGNETFVMPNCGMLIYPQLLNVKTNTTILVWDVYYPFWNSFNKIKGIPIPLFRKSTLETLWRTKGVIFMDKEGKLIFEQNKCVFTDPQMVFIPVSEIEYLYNHPTTTTIELGYIGRAAYWKITPVIHLLKELGKCVRNYKLTIITDDSSIFTKYLQAPENVTIEFKENLYEDNLKTLLKKIDIGIGMGTSALEFAKFGIPTILIDFSHKPFPSNYKFKWIFEKESGNLGIDLSYLPIEKLPFGNSWEIIIDSFKKNKLKISKSCFNYTLNNHSIEMVNENLIKYIGKTTLTPMNLDNSKFKLALLNQKISSMRKYRRLLEMCSPE